MRLCASCGDRSPDAARFCSSCGASLGNPCASCGAEVGPEARFCPSCGAAVQREAANLPTEILKVVSILFADVVGSTARAETMHPEDTRALMTDFFRSMSEEIEAEGGTIESLAGDGIMAIFGWPLGHEDDPERAVRAALAMMDRLVRWNQGRHPSHQIQIRVGINTGEVSAASASGRGLIVTGDPVNIAARLEQSAVPGTVLVGDRTARAVRRSFQIEEMTPLRLKGKTEDMPNFLVHGPLNESESLRKIEAPMIGRDVELDTLVDVFRRARGTGVPHLMTVVGDPGVGKSRLIRELIDSLSEDARLLIGRCLPYGEGVTLWPLREILEGLSGAASATSSEDAIVAIETVVRQLVPSETADPVRIAAALASTLGLEAEPVASLDPRIRHREMVMAWRCVLGAIANEQPLLVVVQDIHWADELMLDVLDDLVDHVEGPVLFLAAARPELFKARPGWGSGSRNSMSMRLDPLTKGSTTELLKGLLGTDRVPARVCDLVLERCEGNPLFVHEVVSQLLDQGVLTGGDASPASLGELELPDNIYGVVSARLDLLSALQRTVAQTAAVVGRSFWQGALEDLLSVADLTETLQELERRNFITERSRSSITDEVEFAFTHVLIRDVAYQTMPRRARAATHRGIAEWIEGRRADRSDEVADLLAHHYTKAYEITDEEELRSKARALNLAAAATARFRFAVRGAAEFGRKAVDLSTKGSEKLEALEAYGNTCLVAFEIDDAWRGYSEALAEARELQDHRASVRLAARAALTATRYEGAMRKVPSAPEVMSVITEGLEGTPQDMARERCLLLASKAFAQGVGYADRDGDGERAASLALEIAEDLDDPELLSVALDARAFWLASEIHYPEVDEIQRRRVELTERLTNVTEICDAFGSASWAAYFVGDYNKSIEFATQCLRKADGVDAGNFAHALQWRVMARFTTGDWDGALEDQARLESLLGADNSFIPVYAGGAFAATCLCHELRQDRERADHYLELLEGLRGEQAAAGEEIYTPRAATALALLHRGELDRARSWIVLDRQYSLALQVEALCQLAGVAQDNHEAEEIAFSARKEVEAARSPSLLAHVERLEALLAARGGEIETALELFASSAEGFAQIGARWDEAMSLLVGAESLVELERTRSLVSGEEIAGGLQRALRVFEQLKTPLEIERTRTILERLRQSV